MKLLLSILAFILSTASYAESFFPKVSDHWLRAAPPNAMMQAAYLTLNNSSEKSYTLVGAYSPDFEMAEIHKTIEVDGLTKMQHQPEIQISKGETVNFVPGGLHVMLMQPKRSFKVGDKVKICLIYEKNGGVDVQHIYFPVKKK